MSCFSVPDLEAPMHIVSSLNPHSDPRNRAPLLSSLHRPSVWLAGGVAFPQSTQ